MNLVLMIRVMFYCGIGFLFGFVSGVVVQKAARFFLLIGLILVLWFFLTL